MKKATTRWFLKMFKILMCDDNRLKLSERNIQYESSLFFYDCLCKAEQKILAIKCENCRYNVIGFARNYFATITCSCKHIVRNLICSHCRWLTYSLNRCARRTCLKPQDVSKNFHLMETDKYLKMHLKPDLFFHYSKEENKILVTIDSPECGDFFLNKEII